MMMVAVSRISISLRKCSSSASIFLLNFRHFKYYEVASGRFESLVVELLVKVGVVKTEVMLEQSVMMGMKVQNGKW